MCIRKIVYTTFLLLSCYAYLLSQNRISGKVADNNLQPLEGVTVLLLNSVDSAYLSGTTTDMDGGFILTNMTSGNYLLSFSMIGFKNVSIPTQIEKGKEFIVSDVLLEEDVHLLSAVTVMGKKTPFKVEPGKTTINLSSALLNSDGSLLEALKKLPGVIIQHDGTIILNGKTGANVLVDDKVTYLSGENLISYLRSIPATSVENIELISNPSSRYDAAGNSGLINIQRKKSTIQGMNLMVSSGKEKGKYIRGYENLSLTLKQNRAAFYTDYSCYWGKDLGGVVSTRYAVNPATPDVIPFMQDLFADRQVKYCTHYVKTGVDYDFSEQLTVGTYLSISHLNRKKYEVSSSDFYLIKEQIDSSLVANTVHDNYHRNWMGGANALYTQGENGKLDASFDFQLFNQGNGLDQRSTFYIPSMQQTERDTLLGKSGGDISIYNGQLNWNHTFSDIWGITTGVKSAWVHINNEAWYRNLIHDNWIEDPALSSGFSYNENIQAAYTQVNSKWSDSFSTEIGLRLENIYQKSHYRSGENDSVFSQQYAHLFPTFTVQYQPADNHSFSFLYNHRIVRPNYRDLNPYVEVTDRFLHDCGNTTLKPELIHNLEFSWVLKKKYAFYLFYTNRRNPITKSFFIEDNNRTLVMPFNLSENHSVGLRMGLNNLKPLNCWTVHINSSLIYKQFQWMFDNVVHDNNRLTPMIHLSNQLSLPCGWGMEASGYYYGFQVEGQAKIHPLWLISAGIRKGFFDNKFSLYIYANDVFWSKKPYIELDGNSLKGWYKEWEDSRAIGVSLTYRFNTGKETKTSRRDSRTEESKRINM